MASSAYPLITTGGPGVGLASSTGSNQYSDTTYPISAVNPTAGTSASPTATNTGGFTVNPLPSPGSSTGQGTTGENTSTPTVGSLGGLINQNGIGTTVSTLYPGLTQTFFNMLEGQIGQGVQPFNGSATLPSSGQQTAPGTLSAPLNSLLQQLQQFYTTGTGGPTGSGTLQQLSQTGDPVDQTPAWQAMIAAENQNTQNNAADLREQFAVGGNLDSSPFGSAMQQFYNQNTLNQNAQLTSATEQAQTQAVQNQLTASQDLTSGSNSLSQYLQGLDQNSISQLLAQFETDLPQNNPLLAYQGGASTTFPPAIANGVGTGGIGGAVSSAGSALSGIADLYGAISNSSNTAG